MDDEATNLTAPRGRRRGAVQTRGAAHMRGAGWLRSMRGDTPGSYRFSDETPPSMMGAVCAALSAEVLDRGLLHENRRAWIDYICTFQRDDGWFEDPLLRHQPGSPHSPEYLRSHQTFLATMALDALGGLPLRPLCFIENWRDDDAVYEFIDALPWSDPWAASNWVEHIGYFLLSDAGLRPADTPIGPQRRPSGFRGLMAWLTDHIDPNTGFWGDPPFEEPHRSHYLMAGAFHHYVFFYATGTAIPAQEHIIDTTLGLQQPHGLFRPGRPGGGPCDDLDAIDILANMSRLTEHRRGDIHDALERASLAILGAQRSDGAFVWAYDPSVWRGFGTRVLPIAHIAGTILNPLSRRGPRERWWRVREQWRDRLGTHMAYAGESRLRFRTAAGDMYSHWFRPLALAIAAQTLPVERRPVSWDFGFRDQITQGWWPSDATRHGRFAESAPRVREPRCVDRSAHAVCDSPLE